MEQEQHTNPRKLSYVHTNLRKWSKNSVGNIFSRKNEIRCRINELDLMEEGDLSPEPVMERKRTGIEMEFLINQEETYWNQRSRKRWIKNGNCKTILSYPCKQLVDGNSNSGDLWRWKEDKCSAGYLEDISRFLQSLPGEGKKNKLKSHFETFLSWRLNKSKMPGRRDNTKKKLKVDCFNSQRMNFLYWMVFQPSSFYQKYWKIIRT